MEVKIPPDVMARLEEEASARHRLHKHQASHRPLSDDYELVGLCGEWAVAHVLGVPMDWKRRLFGDNRKDFTLRDLPVDVKTGNGNAFNLLREVNKRHAEILVLADCNLETAVVEVIGWEFDEEMLNCPTKQFHPKGPINYYKHKSQLKSLDELRLYLSIPSTRAV